LAVFGKQWVKWHVLHKICNYVIFRKLDILPVKVIPILTCYTSSRGTIKISWVHGHCTIWAQVSDGRGRRPPTTVGIRKRRWLPFRVVSKYPQCIVWFCHKAHVWQTYVYRRTDGQTDRQTDRITTPKTALA